MPQVEQFPIDRTDLREAIYMACSALAYMAGTEQPVETDLINRVQKKMALALIQLNNGGLPIPGSWVSSFSASNLPPIFTVTVTDSTTTPALSFTLTAAQANRVLAGPASGVAAAPTYRALVIADIPNLSSVYQLANAKLTAIAALPNAAGYLHNNGSGVFSYGTPPGAINFVAAPATKTSPGVHPSYAVTAFHAYFTISANVWRRVAIGSW